MLSIGIPLGQSNLDPDLYSESVQFRKANMAYEIEKSTDNFTLLCFVVVWMLLEFGSLTRDLKRIILNICVFL